MKQSDRIHLNTRHHWSLVIYSSDCQLIIMSKFLNISIDGYA